MSAPGSDLLASCRATLSSWVAPSTEQDQLRDSFVRFIDDHPDDGWSRENVDAHLTASSLITSPDGRKVLLMLHRKLGRWLQTGGHLESSDPNAEAGALREAHEESGLRELDQRGSVLLLSRHRVPCGPAEVCHHLDLQFLHLADPDAILSPSAESTDFGWFDADDLPDTDDSVRALVTAARLRLS